MPEHMRVMCSLTPAERQCLAYSHNGIAHVAFDHMHSLRFRDVTISWLNHTPHASAVYASCSASLPPHATLASQAARYGLTWAGLAPADRASFGWRLRISCPLSRPEAAVTLRRSKRYLSAINRHNQQSL